MSLTLRNPHSVLAVLETRPHDVLDIGLPAGRPSRNWDRVVQMAASCRIRVRQVSGTARRHQSSRTEYQESGGRLGAACATIRERSGVDLETLFATGNSPPQQGLWLALDCLQDPHNVGAVFRSAACFGVQGIVATPRRSAPLNATVYDVASGALEYVPFAMQVNLARALDQAKQSGLWVLGTSEHAATDLADVDRDRPWLLVLGNEEKGLRDRTLKSCDAVCRLTPRGPVASLNVSVAAGILIAALAPSSATASDLIG